MTDDQWQPISTAPKDGSAILVHSKSLGLVICLYDAEREPEWTHWFTLWDGESLASEPTHWMPLPAPPVVLADQEEPK